MKMNWVALGLIVSVTACASNFTQYYTDYSAGIDYVAPATKDPQIVNVPGSPQEAIYQMYTNGYVLVGESAFNASPEDTSGALAQAKKVGAEFVVLQSKYTNTVSGSIPLTTQQTITSRTDGTATAYGPGGMATGTYSGTTTTSAPTTTNIPYSVSRYDQNALYFAPMKEACMGVLFEDLTDSERVMLGTNKGARVTAVRKGSPAYNADVLPNDYITYFNQEPLTDVTPPPRRGQVFELGIVRGAEKVKLQVIGGSGCSE